MIKIFEYFKNILNYKNFSVFDVNHSIERYKQRVSTNTDDYFYLLKKSIDYLIDNNKVNYEDRYIFYFSIKKFGIQIELRKDRNTGKLAFFTATTLTDNELKYLTKNDKKLLIENISDNNKDLSIDDINNIIEKGFCEIVIPELKENNYSIFIESGEINTDFEFLLL